MTFAETSEFNAVSRTTGCWHREYHPQTCDKIIKKTLLVVQVAFGVISLIPPLRFAGSIGMRTIAVLSSIQLFLNAYESQSALDKALKCGKIILVSLGIVGAILSAPLFIVVSLGVDTLIQLKDLACALKEEKWNQALIHFFMITINVIGIAAIVLGSWKLVVAAAVISSVLMLGIAVKLSITHFKLLNENTEDSRQAFDLETIVDIFCYAALAGIGATSAFTMAEIVHKVPKTATFKLHNTSGYTRCYYDGKEHLLAVLKPDESMDLTVPYNDLRHEFGMVGTKYVLREETPNGPWYSSGTYFRNPNNIDYRITEIQHSIKENDIPLAPFGTMSLNYLC